MKQKKNVVYMEITKDKYELPVAVADTYKELGEMSGVAPWTICNAIRYSFINGSKCKYVKVILDDEE